MVEVAGKASLMSLLIFVVLVGILTAEGIYCAMCLRHSWKDQTDEIILVIVLYANFLWTLIPSYLALITGDFTSLTFGYELDAWNLGLALESVFFFMFFIGWQQTLRIFPPLRVAQSINVSRRELWYLFVVALCAGTGYLLLGGGLTYHPYEQAGDYIRNGTNDTEAVRQGLAGTLLCAFVFPIAAIFSLYVPQGCRSALTTIPSMCLLGWAALAEVATASRGNIIKLFFQLGIVLMLAGRSRRSLRYLLAGLLATIVLSPALVAYRSQLQNYRSTQTLDDKLSGVYQKLVSYANGEGEQSVTEAVQRFDSAQNAGIIATRLDGDFAGYRPFLGAAVAFVPRLLWPAKPLPMSADNSVAGLPAYLAMAYRGEPHNNGSVSPAGVAYWQFGWPGVILTGFLSAFVVRALARAAIRRGAIGVLSLIAFLEMSHFRLPVSLDETLFILMQTAVPLAVVYMPLAGLRHPMTKKPPTSCFVSS